MKFEIDTIDTHIHLYTWFGENGITFFEAFDDYQKRHGMRALNICALPSFSYGDVSLNIMGALYKLHNPSAYSYAGIVYPELPVRLPMPKGMDVLSQYNELMEIGFDGIKMIETKPTDLRHLGISVSHSLYNDFFAEIERNGTHLIWHVADPDTFWDGERVPDWAVKRGWFYGEVGYPSLKEVYNQVFEVLERFPKLNVTFAHFFFLAEHPEVLEQIFAKFSNVAVDLTPGSEMYDGFDRQHQRYREFFEKYADRILYGTDVSFPKSMDYWDNLSDSVYRVLTSDDLIQVHSVKCRGLNLPKHVCEKILHKNFLRKCSEKPNTVNVTALKKYVQKYKSFIRDEETRKIITDYVNKL